MSLMRKGQLTNETIQETGGRDSDNHVQPLKVATDGTLLLGAGTSATEVQGTAADGTVTVGNPVQTGGKDGSGNAQTYLTDALGRAEVNLISGQSAITGGAGAVGASTPRVTLASDDPAVVALQIIDDWDEADRAKVNPIAGQVGVQGASGVVTALTQRVVLATDIALPAGTNYIGRTRLTDGTNDVTTLFDADSGAGSQFVLGVGLRKIASGGSVEAGTATDPLRTDPTGTTAQPVTDNAGSLTVDAPVGTPAFVRLSDGAAAAGTQTNPVFARLSDGTDAALVTAAGELNVTATAQPGVDIGDVTVNNAAGASAVNVQDGGNSITVDSVDLDIRNLTHVASQDSVRIGDGADLALVTAAGELNVIATAQPGVDIGDVTVNNATGASAVNIQDGGNSITIDGTVTADSNRGALTNRSGSITIGGTSQVLAAALATRKYLLIQNISSENLWVDFNVAAVQDQPSIRLIAGDTLVFESSYIPTESVNVIAATTGSKFVAKEA